MSKKIIKVIINNKIIFINSKDVKKIYSKKSKKTPVIPFF
jgi:hypothetical protein